LEASIDDCPPEQQGEMLLSACGRGVARSRYRENFPALSRSGVSLTRIAASRYCIGRNALIDDDLDLPQRIEDLAVEKLVAQACRDRLDGACAGTGGFGIEKCACGL
jgi:hypothetical protein